MTLSVRARITRSNFDFDVDVDWPAEGVTVLFGRSGSGKTTLLRLIAGLERPSDARVSFRHEIWLNGRRWVPLHRRRIAMVFQEASLLPHLSVRENLLYGYKRTPIAERKLHLDEVVRMLGIENIIERNIIKNAMLLINDGGALKSFGGGSQYNIFRNNFVSICKF